MKFRCVSSVFVAAAFSIVLVAGCGDGDSSEDGAGDSRGAAIGAPTTTPPGDDGSEDGGSREHVATDQSAPTSTEASLRGEALKEFDWAKMFPTGDSWKEFEQVFVFNNAAEPETLDPHVMTGVPEHTLALALFEGLTAHHP